MTKDIPQFPDTEDDGSPDLLKSALLGGHAWAPDILKSQIAALGIDASVVQETLQILDMWNAIEYSIGELSPSDRNDLFAEFPGKHLLFCGFDPTDDDVHHLLAETLILNMPRFSQFADRNCDGSRHYLPRCRAMIALFAQMRTDDEHVLLRPDDLRRLLSLL